MEMFHSFEKSVEGIALPDKFTYPFCYVPHELCVFAAAQVRSHIDSVPEFKKDAANGKMFGVLVVRRKDNGDTGFIAAFSGLLAGKANTEYFVPPVFDLTDTNGFFKEEEANISAINEKIEKVFGSCRFNSCMQRLYNTEHYAGEQLRVEKEKMKFAKMMRDERRKAGVTEEEEAEMIRQSQFQKAEYKRLERRLKEDIERAKEDANKLNLEIEAMKAERKVRSAALQEKIFRNFIMLNACGERRNLIDIFNDNGIALPPSGSGECAAPKLLQYAYMENLEPIAMAEFWIGKSPRSEIRIDGNYYPSCTSKCGPILGYMLQGLDVDENPVAVEAGKKYVPKIIYQDKYIIVADKPAGMLTVPGKIVAKSLYDYIIAEFPDISGPGVVHRLDMSTSGLVLIARSKEVHEYLQRQFENRTVVKHYCAVLEGSVKDDEGIISLPLCPDVSNRPRQMVSYEYGKEAVTRFKVMERNGRETRVMFTPLTGRTHQLRVHSASSQGLGCPIKGDMIYGKAEKRLYLHASYLEFVHPVTGEKSVFESHPEF